MKKERQQIIENASWIAIIGNGILSVLKITFGFVSGSLAVVGDGIDSATDILTSIITLVTARIISRPPNAKHPFGYQKADDIAAKVLSFVVFFAGLQLAISTIKKLIEGTQAELPGSWAIYVTIISIVGKLALSIYLKKTGKKTKSYMLVANGKNMQNDVIISVSVLVGLVFTHVLKLPIIDPVVALLVSLWILKVAFEIFMESNIELLDGVKDEKVYQLIFDAVKDVPEVKNPHKVRTRQIAGMYLIDIDIEVDGQISLCEAHGIAHAVESKIREKVENVYDIMVHVEPFGEAHNKEQFGVAPKDV